MAGLAMIKRSHLSLLAAIGVVVMVHAVVGTATANLTQANGSSNEPSISADGRYVAFRSSASNLVSGDTNAASDIFLYDRTANATSRLSTASGGGQANGSSYKPSISDDGQRVAFESLASNLLPPCCIGSDANGTSDVYVHDRGFSVTYRSSGSWMEAWKSDGTDLVGGRSYAPSISGDGERVAFASDAPLDPADTNAARGIYEAKVGAYMNARLSYDEVLGQGLAASDSPSLSRDGTHAAFSSEAPNFTADTNRLADVFVHDWVSFEELLDRGLHSGGAGTSARAGTDSSTVGQEFPAPCRAGEAGGANPLNAEPPKREAPSASSERHCRVMLVSEAADGGQYQVVTLCDPATETWHVIVARPDGTNEVVDLGAECDPGSPTSADTKARCENEQISLIITFIRPDGTPFTRSFRTGLPC
jgi:hypothetical protein